MTPAAMMGPPPASMRLSPFLSVTLPGLPPPIVRIARISATFRVGTPSIPHCRFSFGSWYSGFNGNISLRRRFVIRSWGLPRNRERRSHGCAAASAACHVHLQARCIDRYL